jgi:hypothetical protein
VKLYLLRCDDKETYKEKVRKEVRHWIKSQTSTGDGKSSANKSQEDHDAFEWLIVHVVLPNTPAASQPKSSKHISLETTDSTDSVNSKSKWSGKNSSTIFDKLRADFSSSSKSSINRVSQVRLLESNDKSTALSPAELEEQWQDLTESLKACILRSFDARVAQYESDIRERDNQRNLPGWNFCTFFVLKEGLAKGFESVGLLDDALAVYDELSLGLDGLVKEQAQHDDHDDSGALLSFSKESKNLLRAALDPEAQSSSQDRSKTAFDLQSILSADRDAFPFDVERKNYRHLILSNDVSALDLRIYLFTREMEILTRQGRGDLLKSPEASKTSANLSVLADLTERGVQFINLAARTLRLELYNAWGGQEGLSTEELHTQRTITGNIVSTWKWRASMQLLGQVLPSLGLDLAYGAGLGSIDAVELSRHLDKPSDRSLKAPNNLHRMSLTPESRSPSRERPQGSNNRWSLIPEDAKSQRIASSQPGADRLGLWVCKLVIMVRHCIEGLEGVRPWISEIKEAALDLSPGDENHIPNGDASGARNVEHTDETSTDTDREWMAGLDSDTLRAAASSKSGFLSLYALLSVLAYRVVVEAKSHATARQVLTDLVEMEYAQTNYTVAARYLSSIFENLPLFEYGPTDGHLLQMYAGCLRHLQKRNEYCRCLVACLQCMSQSRFGPYSLGASATSQFYMHQLFEVAPTVTETTLPLTSLFHISGVSRTISHPEGKDGFSMSLNVRTLSGAVTPPMNEMTVRLASKDGNEPRFVMLKQSEEAPILATDAQILLESRVTTHGWYVPHEVEIRIGNLRLLHHFPSGPEEEHAQVDESLRLGSEVGPVLVYPCLRSLEVRIKPSPTLHLAEPRRLSIQVRSGSNHVNNCKLRLKTGTAGLRLSIHDSKILGCEDGSNTLRTAREGEAQMMILEDLKPESVTEIGLPYTMEVPSEPAVTIRIDVSYETDQGTFTLYDTATVNAILPVAVNVQDIFRSDCTYCRFSIRPSTLVPLHLVHCQLEDNKSYELAVGSVFAEPLTVFPKQPACWTVRLACKQGHVFEIAERMTLALDYQSLDDVMLEVLENDFRSEIAKTPYAFAGKLLVSHLLSWVRTSWTEQDLEVAGLLQEVEIWRMEDMNWPSVLCAFDRKTRLGLEEWLHSWHSDRPALAFSSANTPLRQLRLHVDVPPPPVVISATWKLDALRYHTATIGQPLQAEVVMCLANAREEVEGAFEIEASSESWLIGGRRKGSVKLTSAPTRVRIVLFPQTLGHALLPIITVKCRKRSKSSGDGGDAWTEVTSDVHNPDQGRSILITPDLRSTTVEVFGGMPDAGTARLIASTGRGGVG